MNGPDIKLMRHWTWDTINISWGNTEIQYGLQKLTLPSSISVSLVDKPRLRHILRKSHEIKILALQGNEWKELWCFPQSSTEITKLL